MWDSGAPLDRVAAVGGAAQQHATVYLTRDGIENLGAGNVHGTWFSRSASPIWMDSSTGTECAALTARFGSRIQADTGSPATERFAGPQIMRFAKEEPEAYARTARIHLLSSFLSSYLVGEEMPIDFGDGAGMNLLNLKTGGWDAEICTFAAPDLLSRLPELSAVSRCVKPLRPHFAKYGLRPGVPVVPFTGDNPASLVGCGAERPGSVVISLGTSDTLFAAMPEFRTDPEGCGNVFGNPCGGFLVLSCFRNGSLARDRVRRELGVDWRYFDEGAWTEDGRDSSSGILSRPKAYPYFEPEITPRHAATGIEADFDWKQADAGTKIRAVVEGQIFNMYDRTRWIGDFDTVIVTGGASRSSGILRTIGRVFSAKVRTLETPDSAAVGAARLAARTVAGERGG